MKEKIVHLKLTEDKKNKHWLRFKDSRGREAAIRIEHRFPSPNIIDGCVRQWAKDVFAKKEK